MDVTDMGMPDMATPSIVPASWVIAFDPDQSAVTNLSVQASSSPYPKNASYLFSVTDEQGRPIPDVPVTFYLDWSMIAGAGYDACLPTCEDVPTLGACQDHPFPKPFCDFFNEIDA